MHIAEGYERLIVPRFEPWTAVGLATLGELLAAWRPRRAERAAANGDGDDGDDGGADETQEDTADDDSPMLSVLAPAAGPGTSCLVSPRSRTPSPPPLKSRARAPPQTSWWSGSI